MIALLVVTLAAAPEPLTLVRQHTVGQKYSVEYTNADSQLKITKTFKGTAVVKTAADKKASYDVTIDSLEWNKPDGKRSASGVKLKVQLDDGAASAEVVSPGTLGEDAEFELTAFEHMLGDLCAPPKGPFYPGKKLVDGSTAWELLTTGGKVAKLKSTPAPNADPFTCDVTISIDDGFAGERSGRMQVSMANAPKVDQRQTLKVKKL